MDLVAGRVYADERRPIRHIDGLLLLVTAILIVLGFFLLYSATNQPLRQDRLDPFLRVNKQMVTAAIGVVLILVMATFDYRFLKVYAGFIYAGVVVTLLLVRVPFLGSSAAGAQRWFEVAGFQVTPSEFAKLGLIVMLAASLSEMRHSLPTIQDVIRLCGLVVVPLVLVFTQPDIGTSIVLVAIAAGMFLVAGVSGRHLAALVVICLVLIAAAAWSTSLILRARAVEALASEIAAGPPRPAREAAAGTARGRAAVDRRQAGPSPAWGRAPPRRSSSRRRTGSLARRRRGRCVGLVQSCPHRVKTMAMRGS